MTKPLISVITAVYNGSAFVDETIRSILSQTIDNFEYIIIDDASTDDSADHIRKFTDPRIRFIQNSTNLRLVKTRNLGLAAAVGKYIALIDHDDVALPNRFEEQLQAIIDDPELVMVASYAVNIDESGNLGNIRGNINDSDDELKVRLLFRNPFINSTLFFKNYHETGLRYHYKFPLSEDYDFIVRLSEKGKLHLIKKVLLEYRVHTSNYSQTMNHSMIELGSEVKRRLLRGLNIEVNETDLLIHSNFEHQLMPYDQKVLDLMGDWAKKLLKSSDGSAVYEKNIFYNVLYDELSIVAEKSVELMRNNFLYYLKQPYFSALRNNPSAAIRLILKLLIRRSIRNKFYL